MNAQYEQFKSFMDRLFEPTDTVCFAFLQDGLPPQHAFVKASDAFTEASFATLQGRNDAYNVYVAMNTFKPELIGQKVGRKKENVLAIKRLYADADKNGEEVLDSVRMSSKLPPPSITLNTSPGKYQFIWNTTGLTKETAEPLLVSIADELKTDPQVAEIARVLRVPGLKNRKYPDAPMVSIVDEIGKEIFTPSDFSALKVNREIESSKEIPHNAKNLVPVGFIHGFMLTLAGRLRNDGLTPEEILPILRRRVHEECQVPPNGFDDSRIIAMARSAGTWEPNQSGDILFGQNTAAAPVQETQEPSKPIVTVNGDKFLTEIIPLRKVLISTISGNEPVIFEQSINQIFAWRGAGKTCLGMGFVRALATGSCFLNFKATKRQYVLYVEGELPDSQFQERWKSIVGKTDGYAYMASIDKQPGHHYVSLAQQIGMDKIEATLTELEAKGVKIKVLMLDNISTLFNVEANEEKVWISIQSWFTSLRSRGITVFFFHHAGKGGLSRSHSKSEDMLDVSIKLEEPEEPEQGHLHSLMTFDKARAGLSEKPAEIKLHRTHSLRCLCGGTPGILFCPGDGVSWEHIPKTSKRDESYRLFAEGKKVSEVVHELGVPEGTAKTWMTNYNKGVQARFREAAKAQG